LQVFPNPTDSKTNLIISGSSQSIINLIDDNGNGKRNLSGRNLKSIATNCGFRFNGKRGLLRPLNGKRTVKKIIIKRSFYKVESAEGGTRPHPDFCRDATRL